MEKDSYFLSIHDKLGNYIKVCDNVVLVTGYSKSEVIGRSAYDFFDYEDIKNIVSSHVSHVLSFVKYRIRKKDGTFVHVMTLSFKTVNDGIEDGLIHCVTKKMNIMEIIIFKLETNLQKLKDITIHLLK